VVSARRHFQSLTWSLLKTTPKTQNNIFENALTLQHGQRYNLRTIRTTANTSKARINSVRAFRPPWGPGTTRMRVANPLMFARLSEPPRSMAELT
jgi:hypothetical protein